MALSRGKAAAIAALSGLIVAGGATLALATPDATSTPSSTASAAADDSTTDSRGGAPHEHTAVTGDALTKVTDAVKAYNSGITVSSVEADPDGSYDVDGTLDGSEIRLDVSEDLATITERTGAGPGGGGQRGDGSQDTAVTGDAATKVSDAVKAQDANLEVTEVRQDPDGSYDVLGTSGGEQVFYDVSEDLQTVTQNSGGGGHRD